MATRQTMSELAAEREHLLPQRYAYEGEKRCQRCAPAAQAASASFKLETPCGFTSPPAWVGPNSPQLSLTAS